MAYTPPSLSAVDFALTSYSTPSLSAVNFELELWTYYVNVYERVAGTEATSFTTAMFLSSPVDVCRHSESITAYWDTRINVSDPLRTSEVLGSAVDAYLISMVDTAHLIDSTAIQVQAAAMVDYDAGVAEVVTLADLGEAVAGGPYYCTGDTSPISDEMRCSWREWLHVDGSPVTVTGDGNYGKLVLDGPCYSPVYIAPEGMKLIRVENNKYGTGYGVYKTYVRGSESPFLRGDSSPSWMDYSAPFSDSWQYIQIKHDVG